MGRKSSFTEGQVHAAVAGLIGAGGAVSVQDISARAGISVGSLYHRFTSREAILAETWLDAVCRFQDAFLAAIDRSGREAALATPRFCRNEPVRAQVLASALQRELSGVKLPSPLCRQMRHANNRITVAIRAFSRDRGIAPVLSRLALVDMPLTVVRLYLPRHPVPEEADTFVAGAYRGLLRTGETGA